MQCQMRMEIEPERERKMKGTTEMIFFNPTIFPQACDITYADRNSITRRIHVVVLTSGRGHRTLAS